jgi:tRNA (guanine-N7-)-methyltransferase
MERSEAEIQLEQYLAQFPPGTRLEVDLGCAKGVFVAGMAQREPETVFVGIESQLHRVTSTGKKIRRHDLANACVVRGECFLAVREWFSPASVDVFHVSFPDPWPKRRHHLRRLVNPAFLAAVQRTLKPCGSLRLMTDDLPYFQAMNQAVTVCGGFMEIPWDDGREYPQTEFQAHFESQGLPVYRLALGLSAAPIVRASS